MTSAEVKEWIKGYLLDRVGGKVRDGNIPDNVNLVEAGLLDSLGFVGLIAGLETQFQVRLDLINLPVESLVQMNSLAELVVKSGG